MGAKTQKQNDTANLNAKLITPEQTVNRIKTKLDIWKASDKVKVGDIGKVLSMRYLLVIEANTEPSERENLAERFCGLIKNAKSS